MSKKIRIHKKSLPSFLIYPAIAIWFLSGCATPPTGEITADGAKAPLIEQVKVSPSPLETVVEVISSVSAPYTVFKFSDPPRVILDVRGKPGADLSMRTEVNNGSIGDIRFEEGMTQTMTTRMIVTLTKPVDYRVATEENRIRLTLTPKREISEPREQVRKDLSQTQVKEKPTKAKFTPSEPRILIKPLPSKLNQILGIDFTMLEHGKSRLTVTTKKKVRYDLDRKGEKALILKLYNTTIPSLLLREIDTTHFNTALDRVKPALSTEKKEVSLVLSLRDMVPFHVKQTDEGLSMDFGRTAIKPPEKKIIPLDLAEAQTRPLAATQPSPTPKMLPPSPSVTAQKKGFQGEPMFLEFVSADVTHILRLINEVSEENIIWDPAIAGRKVSMILKNVPWDEALALILDSNDLAKRYRGKNIIWVTTKAKMKQIEAEERAERKRLEAERKKEEEEEKQAKKEAKMEAEEKVELITEFIPVDFAKADEIKGHITLSEKGKKRGASLSVDTRTNTIVMKDIASSIKEAKKTVKQFDIPVKQIMIEAKIVDASDTFSRDLGLKWNSTTSGWRKKYPTTALTDPANANAFTVEGERLWGGSFSTNSPTGWGNNIGLSFANLTSSGLGYLTLDASLALAETEGKAKVMSAPKVIAREGTSASISSGDTIIIPATENVASTTLPANLSLQVTPSSVSYNNFITMDITVSDDQAPSTSRLLTKSISTTMMIKSGETVVIGGILKESEGNDETGLPVLKDIPGLGWLFKATRKTYSKSELLIFLTPTVLPSPVKTY
ncbi:AMIN domain-containing protein [Thermodesulfobacteriota bacterium]